MNIKTLTVGPLEANCYIIWTAGEDALVIDPGADAARIVDVLTKNKLSVSAYLLTHGHADHISALADMHEACPAPIALHAGALALAFEDWNQFPPYCSVPRRPALIERVLRNVQEWTDAGLLYRVIPSPGHSPGGVCFYFPEQHCLFTGDTLFAGSVGRSDFPGGDPKLLSESLARLLEFPERTAIYPGHGPASTLKQEKQTNVFVQ